MVAKEEYKSNGKEAVSYLRILIQIQVVYLLAHFPSLLFKVYQYSSISINTNIKYLSNIFKMDNSPIQSTSTANLPTPNVKMTAILSPGQIAGRERFSIIHRQMIEEEAARDESKPTSETTLWKSARGLIDNINLRYRISNNPIILFEWDMHDFWHLMLQAAKVTPADDAGMDRLVSQVLYAREMGTITRTTTVPEGQFEEAVTSDGERIWTDMPYLVKDFRVFWEKSMELSPVHRRNAAAFTAKLAALRFGDGNLSCCAVWLLRETFETKRRLTRADPGDEVPISELLPACNEWFRHCGHKLLPLAISNHTFADNPASLAPGELAQTELGKDGGLSIARWLFWRRMVKKLNRWGGEVLANESKSLFLFMISTGRTIGLKVDGEDEYDARTQKYLMDKRERSEWDGHPGVVTSEAMSIHSDDES